MKLKQLQEKRGSLLKEIRDILNADGVESRGLSADEQAKVANLETEVANVQAAIDAEVRQISRESIRPIQLSEGEQRDQQRFDFAKLLGHLHRSAKGSNVGVLDGIEAEMIQEGEREARSAGIESSGILLPRVLVRRENRDMTATGTTSTTGDQGGMTIATQKAGLLDDFFNASVIRGLGSTVLEGLQGNLDIPRIIAGTAGAKKAENAASDEVTPTTAMLSLSPKRLPAYIDISEQLLRQSSSAIESILRGHLTTQMGAVREAAFSQGGGTNGPTGIAGTAGIGSVAGGTNGAAPVWTHLTQLEEKVDAQNALLGSLAYATNGQIRRKLKETPRQSSGVEGNFLLGLDGMANGYKIGFTNAISRTLTKGSSSVASAIFFGNFADFYEAYWGGVSLEMVRDKTNAISGLYTLVASCYYDGGVVRPKSFSAMLDALGA